MDRHWSSCLTGNFKTIFSIGYDCAILYSQHMELLDCNVYGVVVLHA